MWTVLFVIVNQVAYTVVVRIASSGTADAATTALGGNGTGYTVYSSAFLVMMVPHSIATVSLATAMLPRLSARAADDDLPGVARNVASTLRTTLALIVPFAVLLPLIAHDVSNLMWGYAAAKDTFADFGVALALFAPGPGLLHHPLPDAAGLLRAGAHPHGVLGAVRDRGGQHHPGRSLLARSASPENTAPGLVISYGGAYAVGAVCSYLLLRHVLGGLETPALVRFLGRLVVAAGVAGLVGLAVRYGIDVTWGGDGKLRAAVTLGAVTASGVVVYLALSRVLRIEEVTGVARLISGRLGR